MGFSTIVWTRTLLNVTAQFGITGHVPDFECALVKELRQAGGKYATFCSFAIEGVAQ